MGTETSGFEFWESSFCHNKEGATATATSGAVTAAYVLTHRLTAKWLSVGSVNGDNEVLTITLPQAKECTVLHVSKHNITDILAEVEVGGSWQTLTGETVTLIDGSKASYYLFDALNVSKVRVSGANTTDGGEKYIQRVILSKRIGRIREHIAGTGHNVTKPTMSLNYNEITHRNLAGRGFFQRGEGLANINLAITVTSEQHNVDIVKGLYSRDSFLVWPSGATAPVYHKVKTPMFEWDAVYKMAVTGSMDNNHYKNLFGSGAVYTMSFLELA